MPSCTCAELLYMRARERRIIVEHRFGSGYTTSTGIVVRSWLWAADINQQNRAHSTCRSNRVGDHEPYARLHTSASSTVTYVSYADVYSRALFEVSERWVAMGKNLQPFSAIATEDIYWPLLLFLKSFSSARSMQSVRSNWPIIFCSVPLLTSLNTKQLKL